MTHRHLIVSLLGACAVLALQPASAQTSKDTSQAPVTRPEEMKMEREQFLRMYVWDEASSTWKLKSGVEPSQPLKSPAEIKAEREAFLSRHRWNDEEGAWKPVNGPSRPTSTLTTEQRRAETARFMSTHRWDERNQTWVERKAMERE
ncbi:hypothetical protein [Caldimonas brevitalea]|nr:hypothetical protein [Caldimonas brevitalea]